MGELGIIPDDFNPKIFYILNRKFSDKCTEKTHAHDFLSLIYVLSSSCIYHINNHDYVAKKGDIIICNPGISHGRTLYEGQEVSEFHLGVNDIQIKNLPKNCLIAPHITPVIQLAKYESDFFKCYTEILRHQEKNEPGFDLLLKCLVMKMLVMVLKETYFKQHPQAANGFEFETYDKTTIVNTIVDYMDENYMHTISLDKISRNLYLSPVYISKIFKEETGESPINHLIKVRLAKAREILQQSSLSIKEVAKSVGYEDPYYFSKLFKKYYGTSPLKFKQNSEKNA